MARLEARGACLSTLPPALLVKRPYRAPRPRGWPLRASVWPAISRDRALSLQDVDRMARHSIK